MSEDYLAEVNAKTVKFVHGSVAASWAADEATATAQSATYTFAVTDVVIDVQTDLTAEAATQPVPVRCTIYSNTSSADIIGLQACVPNNCHIPLQTPILIPKSTNYETRLQLGGATAATCDVYLVGYDCL